jgi:hypothetical protein
MTEFSGRSVWMMMIRWIESGVEVIKCCFVVAVKIKKLTEFVRRGIKG